MAWLSKDSRSEIELTHGPSLGHSNLSYDERGLTLIHGTSACVVPIAALEKRRGSVAAIRSLPYDDQVLVTSVHWCRWNDNSVSLALTTYQGVHVFAADAKSMMFWFPLPSETDLPSPEFKESVARYLYGAIPVLDEDGKRFHMCIGSSMGHIFSFECTKEITDTGTVADQAGKENIHKSAVLALASSIESSTKKSLFVSGDYNGVLAIWSVSHGAYSLVWSHAHPSGRCITAVCVKDRWACASFETGCIGVYDMEKKFQFAEIAAHSRIIHGLEAHPILPVIASVSHDSALRIWKLPSEEQGEIKLEFEDFVENGSLTGVVFWGPEHMNVAVAAYDCRAMHVWIPPKK